MKLWGGIDKAKGEKHFHEAYMCHSILRYVVPREATQSNAVAMVGSSALQWYQMERGVGPRFWGPNDRDILVCGSFGATRSAFYALMSTIVTNMIESGHRIRRKSLHWNVYVSPDKPVLILDIWLKGMTKAFSFIQCPECTTVQEAVEQFDIDVCKVIYHIHQDRFSMKESVRHHIEQSKAEVCSFVFGTGGPTNFDSIRVSMTMRRMQKYSRRGFHIVNGEGLTFTHHS